MDIYICIETHVCLLTYLPKCIHPNIIYTYAYILVYIHTVIWNYISICVICVFMDIHTYMPMHYYYKTCIALQDFGFPRQAFAMPTKAWLHQVWGKMLHLPNYTKHRWHKICAKVERHRTKGGRLAPPW